MASKKLARRFVPIGSHTLLSPGNIKASVSPTAAPELILIFAWLDAQLPHVYKYTEGYNTLYPTSDQIIIRADQKTFWFSDKYRASALRPVVQALKDRDIHSLHDESSRVLIHAMSNGGCFQLCALTRLLALSRSAENSSKVDDESQASGSAFFFDSCPGKPSFSIMALAMTAGIKNRWLRAIAYYPAGLSFYIYKLCDPAALFGFRRDVFSQLWADLIDPKLVPPTSPRFYIYSIPDLLVPYRDVEKHIEAAQQSGVQSITVRKLQGTSHVNHLKADPAAYWEGVRKLWNRET